MASNITIEATPEDGERVEYEQVRSALTVLDGDDLSQSSPVTPGVPEAGINAGGAGVVVRVEGHDGEFTKTTQRALKSAISGISGVDSVEVTAGGYDDGETGGGE